MEVRLVKAPANWEPLPFHKIFVETGLVVGSEQSIDTHWKKLYRVKFSNGEFWLARENIESTSARGVKIEQPAVRENGLYWITLSPDEWTVAQWRDGHLGTFSFGCTHGVIRCDACHRRVTQHDAVQSFVQKIERLNNILTPHFPSRINTD